MPTVDEPLLRTLAAAADLTKSVSLSPELVNGKNTASLCLRRLMGKVSMSPLTGPRRWVRVVSFRGRTITGPCVIEAPSTPYSMPTENLDDALSVLKRDLSKLSVHLRMVDHAVTTECDQLTIRLHYPAFRQGKPMVAELIDAVSMHIIHFCLPRKQIQGVHELYSKIGVEEFTQKVEVLRQEAYDLFKRAHLATNRNGEAGEIILYLLIEWLLGAPQIIAKMSLKTNTEMPVHGADGVHARYCAATGHLYIYWGESKVYANIGHAITKAAESIAESLEDEKVKHEISLIKRYLDFFGLTDGAKAAMLNMLDPFGSEYAKRYDVISCLIVFDFDAFATAQAAKNDPEQRFQELALKKLSEVAPKIAKALMDKGIEHDPVEMFIIPVPSVDRFRDLFQDKIGWKHPDTAVKKKAKSKKKHGEECGGKA